MLNFSTEGVLPEIPTRTKFHRVQKTARISRKNFGRSNRQRSGNQAFLASAAASLSLLTDSLFMPASTGLGLSITKR